MKKLCKFYRKEHILLSKLKLINNSEESNVSELKIMIKKLIQGQKISTKKH